jgi:hypothetical protein
MVIINSCILTYYLEIEILGITVLFTKSLYSLRKFNFIQHTFNIISEFNY